MRTTSETSETMLNAPTFESLVLQKKTKKELKEMRTISETSGTMLNAPTFES